MIEQLERSVSAFIEELRRTERDIEATYLSLGELFPRLVAETEASSRSARESVDAIVGALGAGGRGEVEEFLASASRFFEDLRRHDNTFLASVNAGVERLSTLDDIISRVRLDSEEMEIVSLNALTAALKSGSAGKAFSVITDELKQLSARTIATTEDISYQGQELLKSFRSLGKDLTELAELQDRFFEDIRSTLSGGFSSLEARVQAASASYRELAEEAAGVKEPIVGIMQGVQIQDILRQSINHVILSLEEIAKDADVPLQDELVFTSSVAELSIAVLDDVIAKIDSCVREMSGQIDEVVSIVETVDERRRAIVEGYDDAGVSSGAALEKVESYLSLKKGAISAGQGLSHQVARLNDTFKRLSTLLGRFQNIVVASRIEIARTRALKVVSNTVSGMIEITESLGADVGSATEVTRSFIKTSSADILSYDQAQGQSDQRLYTAVNRMESELQRLETAQERVKETIASFRLYTPDFLELINTSRSALGNLSGFSQTLRQYRDRLETLRQQASQEADRLGGTTVDLTTIRNERLRRIVERFTIFTHKKTAGELGDFQVEEGVDSGDVTLF